MGVELNYPLLLNLYVFRRVGYDLTILKRYDTCVLFEISFLTLSPLTLLIFIV